MSDPKTTPSWIKDQIRTALPMLGMLVVVLALFLSLSYLTSKVLKTIGLKEVALVLGLMVLLAALSCVASAILARLHLEKRLGIALNEVRQAADRLKHEAATVIQLVNLLKGEKTWLVADREVYAIEASADLSIDVVAPDLYYEEQLEYQEVIARNISMTSGPTYRYLVPDHADTRSQARRVVEGLCRILAAAKIADLEQVVSERFQVGFLEEREEFPSASLHGLAIYTWRNGKRQCLQYLPREFGALNVNIPLPENWPGDVKIGGKVVDSATDEFASLFAKADRLKQ